MHRVRDPVHGFIALRPVEAALVDTAPVQRLRRIHQLGLTWYVYPGAEHSRFGHSLGAMHVAGRVATQLQGAGWRGSIEAVRISALLHDIGHPPLSHAGERGERHERTTLRLLRHASIAQVLEAHDVDPESISTILDGSGDPVAHAIVAGQLDADRMDYLLRDSRMCGVRYGEFDLDRVVESLTLSARGTVGLRRGGLHAAEGLILARYSMFTQVYFHRTRRVLDQMIDEVLPEWPEDLDAWLEWDDGRLWETLRRDPSPVAQDIVHRRLPTCVAEVEVGVGAQDEADALFRWVADAVTGRVRIDSSARMAAFRPDQDLVIVEADGREESVFRASPALRRMDPNVEVRRIYVDRDVAVAARERVAAFRARNSQLRLF